MNVRYRVTLSEAERAQLEALLAGGTRKVRVVRRAQILLAAHRGATAAQITQALGASAATSYRVKQRYVERGLTAALHETPRPGSRRKLSAKEEALLVATACSAPPAGRARWTLRLLAGQLVALTPHAAVSYETVRRRLHAQELKPWQEKMWCVPTIDAAYVARMEDVLDLYAEPPDPARPVVGFDETPVGLIGELRAPAPPAPGRPARRDFEYVRHGSANLFMMVEPHRGWRHVAVTARRDAAQFAHQIRALADEHFPAAQRIRVVLDNLSTHTEAALYETFAPSEARRLLRKVEFHYTPKHASWLNVAEIEIGVLKQQCLSRRIPDVPTLGRELAAWEHARNAAGAQIRWRFTTDQARTKLGRVYKTVDAARTAAENGPREDAA